MFVNKEFTPEKQPFLSSILYRKSGIISKGIESEKDIKNSDTNLCIKMRQTGASIVIQKGTHILIVYVPFVSSLGFCFVSEYFWVFRNGGECKELMNERNVKTMDEKTFLKIANLISQHCSIPQLKHLIKIEEKAINNNREKLVKEYSDYVKKMQNL